RGPSSGTKRRVTLIERALAPSTLCCKTVSTTDRCAPGCQQRRGPAGDSAASGHPPPALPIHDQRALPPTPPTPSRQRRLHPFGLYSRWLPRGLVLSLHPALIVQPLGITPTRQHRPSMTYSASRSLVLMTWVWNGKRKSAVWP